jgi:hypothetical protein
LLTRIDVVKGDGSDDLVLSLPILGATPKSSLLVQKVTGLGPADINLFIGDFSRDGGIYQGRRVGNRNPVMTITLNPDPALDETVKSLRETLYKAFVDPLVDADFVKLNLIDDVDDVRYLVGYTEKFETDPFDVETVAQISMLCPDPYIRDNDEIVLTDVSGWVTVPFTYNGTAETGFETMISISSATSFLTLENNGKTMVFEYSFLTGDEVYINTTRGARSLTLVRSSVESSLLAALTPESPWLELHSQGNVMKVYGETSGDTIATIQSLSYRQAYWGI